MDVSLLPGEKINRGAPKHPSLFFSASICQSGERTITTNARRADNELYSNWS